MCGILGYIGSQQHIEETVFKQALHKLSLRGPDAQNMKVFRGGMLGHCRLSVIDTSDSANQPMCSDDGRYLLVFNGELFNYRQLRNEKLQSLGIAFKTSSDTEVLLHLLIQYGSSCLSWLSGFFAFAFYDTKTDYLLLARDRFGKKPLLIYEDENKFVFGSELKALLALPLQRRLDHTSLALYLQLNYLPPDRCMLQHFRKLKPAHYLVRQQGQQTEQPYYQTLIHATRYTQHTYEDAGKQLIHLLNQSVEERLISDVPLGAFLSGGIDSSVIVALAAKLSGSIKTFTIGFKDNTLYDESAYAEMVAKMYRTDHEVFFLNEHDYQQEVLHVLDYLDEPFADSSAIPQFILCKHTRKHVTVALSGDGGDEVFAGYRKHHAEWYLRQHPMLALAARSGSWLWKILPQNKHTSFGSLIHRLNKLGDGASLPARQRYLRWCSILPVHEAHRALHPRLQQSLTMAQLHQSLDPYSRGIRSSDFNELLLADLKLVLPGDMLYKVDMMSMANSLEVRSPFLDYRVVDFAFELPASYKIDNHLKKKLVQDTFRPLLPEALYNRPKQGFEIPLLHWFRNEFNAMIFDQLLHPKVIEEQQIFDKQFILTLKRKLHSSNPGNVTATLWALVVFQHWYNRYLPDSGLQA